MTIAVKKNLALDAGATWRQTFRYKNADGTGVDLAGWTGEFFILKRGLEEVVVKAVELDLSELNGELGYIQVYISDEETELLEPKLYAYTLELEDPNGDIHRLLFGQFDVRSGSSV
jgi:hypothetical protein